MKDKIQDKVNKVRKLATSPVEISVTKSNVAFRGDDSLAKVIRTTREAEVFLAELNAAIAISKK